MENFNEFRKEVAEVEKEFRKLNEELETETKKFKKWVAQASPKSLDEKMEKRMESIRAIRLQLLHLEVRRNSIFYRISH